MSTAIVSSFCEVGYRNSSVDFHHRVSNKHQNLTSPASILLAFYFPSLQLYCPISIPPSHLCKLLPLSNASSAVLCCPNDVSLSLSWMREKSLWSQSRLRGRIRGRVRSIRFGRSWRRRLLFRCSSWCCCCLLCIRSQNEEVMAHIFSAFVCLLVNNLL